MVLLHGQPGRSTSWRRVRALLPPAAHRSRSGPPRLRHQPRPARRVPPQRRRGAPAPRRAGTRGRRRPLVGRWRGGRPRRSPSRARREARARLVGGSGLREPRRPSRAAPPARGSRPRDRDAARAARSYSSFLVEQRALLEELDDVIGALGSIRAPTTVLRGERDATISAGVADRLAAAIPDARLVVVPRSGHTLPQRNPRAVARAIVDTLARGALIRAPAPRVSSPRPCSSWPPAAPEGRRRCRRSARRARGTPERTRPTSTRSRARPSRAASRCP